MVVKVAAGATFAAGPPEVLISPSAAYMLGTRRNYDVSPDGRRFLFAKEGGQGGITHVNVVLNWDLELAAKLTRGK